MNASGRKARSGQAATDKIGLGRFSEHGWNPLAGGHEPCDMLAHGSAGWRLRL